MWPTFCPNPLPWRGIIMKRLTPDRCLTIDRLDAKQHVKTSSKSTFSILFPMNPILHSHFSIAIESPSWSSSTTIFPNKEEDGNQAMWHLNVCVLMSHEETNPARLRHCPLGPCRHYKSVLIEESSLGPQWIKQQFPFSQKTAGEGTWTHYTFGFGSSPAKGLRDFLQGVGKEKNTS